MGVNGWDHLREGALHQVPESGRGEGVAYLVGVEPIHRLYQLPGLAPLLHPLVDGGLDGWVNVVQFEVVKGLVCHERLQGLVELHRSLRGEVAPRLIGIHPPEARGYLQAVEVVVEGGVGDVVAIGPDGVYAVVEGVVQDATVHQAVGDDDGPTWEILVQVAERLEVVGVELLRGGHVIDVRVPAAHVVADELKHDERRVVGLVPGIALDDVLRHGRRTGPVDGNVLVVPVVAPVNCPHPEVGGVHGASDPAPGGVGVGCGAGQHGPVQLVLQDEEDVLEGVHAEVPACEPLRGDVEVGPDAVAEDGRTHLSCPFTQLRLVGLSRVRVRAVYAVAVGVDEGVVRCVPARVDSGVRVGAVLPAPRGAAKRVQVGEVVVVNVVHGKVVVAEPLEDLADGLHDGDAAEVRKIRPFRRGGSFPCRFDPLLCAGGGEGKQVTHLPGGARAHPDGQAHDVRGFLVLEQFDHLRAVIQDQHYARLLQPRWQELAEAGQRLGDRYVVYLGHLFHEARYDGARHALRAAILVAHAKWPGSEGTRCGCEEHDAH